MLANGSAIIKPDNSGFLPESQLANAIIIAANEILKKKSIFLFKVTLYKYLLNAYQLNNF